MALLEVEGLAKRYADVAGHAGPEVLSGLDLSVESGEAVTIVGPSGSGKSTLLNLLGGLDRPTAGGVRLDGTELSALGVDALADLRARRIGFVFQAHHLLPQLTALENALVPTLLIEPGARSLAEARVRALFERVGLSGRMDHRPAQLSGGERQRVAVVRALANGPGLLLADEPTGSLDSARAEELGDLLLGVRADEGVGLVVVTHSMHLAERMDRALALEDGRLVEVTRQV